MRKPVVSLVVGVFIAVVSLLAPGRSPVIVTAQPAVDLTGDWGIVYAQGTATFGECTFGESQTIGGGLSTTTPMECEANGIPTASGGVITGTVTGLNVDGQVTFTAPAMTVWASGIASADGNAQQGNWGITPNPNPYGTYIGSRLVTTPSGSAQTVTVVSGGTTYTVTFDTVNGAGGTTVVSDSSTSGTLPGQFQALGLYFHVITTALYAPPLTFCASYQEDSNNWVMVNGNYVIVNGNNVYEQGLHLLHNEGGNLVDRTDPDGSGTTNYVTNILCATVSSLSEFALVVPKSAVGGIAELPEVAATPLEAPESSGANVGLIVAALLAAGVVTLASGAWYARRRWLR